MDKREFKKLLAGLSIAGLVAGGGVGCTARAGSG
ncbi:MAG: hypothetical protein COX17_00775 [Deltaproteobacteria bacterium CG23_combo_of_CG06-09_8_20_14_all_60_8]|nr:MAG: hypothetical protein COX17_00775 [Deltaproteobacteria bacterium CG23_combo_of_CG06-09_8_20_14_all_60_8]